MRRASVKKRRIAVVVQFEYMTALGLEKDFSLCSK